MYSNEFFLDNGEKFPFDISRFNENVLKAFLYLAKSPKPISFWIYGCLAAFAFSDSGCKLDIDRLLFSFSVMIFFLNTN